MKYPRHPDKFAIMANAPTCRNCGYPESWHSAIDNQCPDDDSPHPDSETENTNSEN